MLLVIPIEKSARCEATDQIDHTMDRFNLGR